MRPATVHCYGDDINTDVILPGQYLNLFSEHDLKPHCMEGIDPDFCSRVQAGDVMIGGKNFGIGSSREHAPIAIKASGISCVIAISFARIFYRNAINIGLPVFECPELKARIHTGDQVQVDPRSGRLLIHGTTYTARPHPRVIDDILDTGGLVSYVRKRIQTAVPQPQHRKMLAKHESASELRSQRLTLQRY